jgi:hypothetical protein
MDTPNKRGDPSRNLTSIGKHIVSSARDAKVSPRNENVPSHNIPPLKVTYHTKIHRSNSEDEIELTRRKNLNSSKGKVSLKPSQAEVNYMQFYKGDREFRLISDVARASMLDDLCELDKCHYLNNYMFDIENDNFKGGLSSGKSQKVEVSIY